MEQLVKTAEARIIFISSLIGISILSTSGILEHCINAVERGVRVRFVTEILPRNISSVREALAGGIEVRHFDNYAGMRYLVADTRESLTTITFDALRHGKDASDTAFWTNSPEFAQYLESSFEILWNDGVEAAQRVDAVLADIDGARVKAAKNSP